MLFIDANKLLEPGYSSLETGYYRLVDNQILVAALTRMPGCDGEMVDWWFGYLDDSAKYRMWCPKDHLELEIQGPRPMGQYIKTSLMITRRMGESVKRSQMRFHDPSDFLSSYDPSIHQDITVICANVYTPEKVLESRIIHCVRNTDFGCEMRSRLWLVNETDDTATDMMTHCLEEMGNLAVFLPDLFAHRKDDI